jgi:adenosylcobyric acid synthase
MTGPIFVGGTSSNAGKSWMATALCAWLRQRGVRVAPFKAQNMSNNSYPCASGGEIGRAQAAQAAACGLDPEPAMNPILLKPNGCGGSQVVVNGRVWKTVSPRQYYSHFEELMPHVLNAYETLASRFDVIVIEGAGSVSELNLRAFDLVNLGLVTRVRAPWLLVADIERGGVFASILGTVSLLTADERALFRGFMINKFRGDRSLFDEGVRILETRSESPCLGVFPFAEDMKVAAEDSLVLDAELQARAGSLSRSSDEAAAGASIAIIRLPCLSNFTDFRLLTWADWIDTIPDRDYDVIILPGSKNTIADLGWMRARGLDQWVIDQHRRAATVVGICAGFQMLGRAVHDPEHVESDAGSARGLGLIAAETTLARDKTTRVVSATTPRGSTFRAYEIHAGLTSFDGPVAPFAHIAGGACDGVRGDRVIGTYLHGALEDAAVCSEVLGVAVAAIEPEMQAHHRLAAWFDEHARSMEVLGL